MLLGGESIYDHCRKRLGIENKQNTSDGTFSLEEVECIGACVGAPAAQINYDFYENLTPEKSTGSLKASQRKANRELIRT